MKARGNQVVLPLNVAKMIDESDPVFKMADLLGELDYRKLRRTYRRHWRSVDPEIMFICYTPKIISKQKNRQIAN